MESRATHPIGKAFTDYIEERKISILNVKEFENIAGYGITGNIEGKEIIIGNSKILEKYQIETHIRQKKKI